MRILVFDSGDDFHQTIVRLTSRRFGDIAPVKEKGVLQFPIRHFGSGLRKAGPSKTS